MILRMTQVDRVSPPVWQGVSGGRYAIGLDNIVAHIKALNAHPFFDKIDGYAEQDEAVGAAKIAPEQKTSGVANESPGFIYACPGFYHAVNLSHP